jgi:hypothetical protein
VRYVQGQTLTIEQQIARLLLSSRLSGSLFVSSQTMNLFRSHVPLYVFNRITPLLQLLLPVKYQRRFSRRLRHRFNFEREDANLLALATFGTDQPAGILGVDILVTFDKRFMERFAIHYPDIQNLLTRMTSHFALPYSSAELPELATPGEVIQLFGQVP